MGMNHRWGVRESIEREVVIYGSGAKLLRGHSRDMSFDGIFVSMSTGSLELRTLVELVVTLRSRCMTPMHRIPAIVARLTERGMGLMFASRDPGEISRFVALLRGSESFLMVRKSDSCRAFFRHAAMDGKVILATTGPKVGMDDGWADVDSNDGRSLTTGGNHGNDKVS